MKEGQPVDIRAAYNDETTVSGVVERIAPVVDPTTGSVRVFINVEKGQSVLRPGQFVKAQVEVARHENTIVLPKEAVVYEDGAPIAYIVTDAPVEEPPVENTEPDSTDDENKNSSKEDKVKPKGPPKPKFVADRRELTIGFSDMRLANETAGCF